jgi:hypothetical protein
MPSKEVGIRVPAVIGCSASKGGQLMQLVEMPANERKALEEAQRVNDVKKPALVQKRCSITSHSVVAYVSVGRDLE